MLSRLTLKEIHNLNDSEEKDGPKRLKKTEHLVDEEQNKNQDYFNDTNILGERTSFRIRAGMVKIVKTHFMNMYASTFLMLVIMVLSAHRITSRFVMPGLIC